jgi:hypothetical protein
MYPTVIVALVEANRSISVDIEESFNTDHFPSMRSDAQEGAAQ